jgi:hypothetical protein
MREMMTQINTTGWFVNPSILKSYLQNVVSEIHKKFSIVYKKSLSLARSLTHSLTHSLVRSLIHSLASSLNRQSYFLVIYK